MRRRAYRYVLRIFGWVVPETLTHARRPPADDTPATDRDSYFDNAKFLLVLLVVAGHTWSPLVERMSAVKAAYLFVYAFHMPLFILLCGYFSRRFTATPAQIRKLITGVLLPYLLFEAVYAAMYTVVWDQPFSVTPTDPRYLTWFLLALFLWRLTAPVWRAVRHPVAVAVLISLAAGLTSVGDELALPRVLQFLPWFVLGLRLRPEHFRALRTVTVRRLALLVLVGGAAGAYWLAPRVRTAWLLMQSTSGDLEVSPGRYLLVRLALFALAALLGAAFLALVPARATVFSLLGAVTLYPYLLHGLLVKTLQGTGGYDLLARGGLLVAALLTLLAMVVAVLLCGVPVRRALAPLVEPRIPQWLWASSDPAEPLPAGSAPAPAAGTETAAAQPPQPLQPPAPPPPLKPPHPPHPPAAAPYEAR